MVLLLRGGPGERRGAGRNRLALLTRSILSITPPSRGRGEKNEFFPTSPYVSRAHSE